MVKNAMVGIGTGKKRFSLGKEIIDDFSVAGQVQSNEYQCRTKCDRM